MDKCFVLNSEKNWRRSVLSFSRKTHTLILKNDVTEPDSAGLLAACGVGSCNSLPYAKWKP